MTDASGASLAAMAVCLAAALAVWLTLVFMADRSQSGRAQENSPHREVVGGTFEARHGGRQVMPDPTEPIVHGPDAAARVPGQRPSTEAEKSATGPKPG
jgi:hypothetical protein